MNGTIEKLHQILHCMTNTFLKNSNFTTQYWVELIFSTNYLQNREPVIGRNIIFFEVDIGRPLRVGYLHLIGLSGFAQLRKLAISWHYFQDHVCILRLIGYKCNYIYRIINISGKLYIILM